MKKKLLSLALALTLLITAGMPVSAAANLAVTRVEETITYDACSFGVYARLDTYGFQYLIQLYYTTGDKDYADYMLRTSCEYYFYDDEGIIIQGNLVRSTPATQISTLNRTLENRVYCTYGRFLINDEIVYSADLCAE